MRSTDQPPSLRHDPLTGRTVVVAPGRADRPNELAGDSVRCPFCAGNESLTPPDLLRAPRSPTEPWRARIVPNRFPVAMDGDAPLARAAPERASGADRPSHGVHDVVIESPAHLASILAIDPVGWREVWELCRERLAELSCRGDLAWATVFKNSGARAGASLAHVHSQLVGLDFVPPAIEAELLAAGRSDDPFGDCLRRAAAEDRIVEERGELVAVAAAAPRQPFETWILPRTAERHFHETSADRVAALAALTQSVIGRLDRLVPGAHYNWWLHQAPYRAPAGTKSPPTPAADPAADRWHWHLEILPRINGLAGFELGAGCHITTVTPRDSARLLREA